MEEYNVTKYFLKDKLSVTALTCQNKPLIYYKDKLYQDSMQQNFIIFFHSHLFSIGHLMGKKSAGLIPYTYEEEEKIPYSPSPDGMKHLEGFLQQAEMLKNLLNLNPVNENKNLQWVKKSITSNGESSDASFNKHER
ncbi:gastrin-releasing peptide-like [Protopterus annectens]|uniref:gastrin-releasing peptide-like n=1 Tax=Protopterus annectens TaxID=7888 RepID=UPI001CF95730|nr:gastrin-releasing peptide-like [Protopterus annectens]